MLEDYIKNKLKIDGFKRSKEYKTWFKKTKDETYFFVNLQKSRYKDSFFFNIGIKYKGIDRIGWDEDNPLLDSTDTSARAESYSLPSELIFLNLMSASGINNNEKKEIIEQAYNYIIDFFGKNKTKEQFKINHTEYKMLDNVAISSKLRIYCES